MLRSFVNVLTELLVRQSCAHYLRQKMNCLCCYGYSHEEDKFVQLLSFLRGLGGER